MKYKIALTPLAKQKYDEVLNGSKESVKGFLDNINESIEKKDYTLLFEGVEKFYYKKCNKIYVIFFIKEKTIVIVDFLVEEEFKKIKE
jgi:hypothetical protein